jgi:hypothetical protein
MRRLWIMIAAVLFLSLALPGLSSATPSAYTVGGDSGLTVQLRSGAEFKVDLRGRVSYDPETSVLAGIVRRSGAQWSRIPIYFKETPTSSGDDGSLQFAIVLPTSFNASLWLDLRPISTVSPAVGVPTVPEPSAALLFGAGLFVVGAAGKRRGIH